MKVRSLAAVFDRAPLMITVSALEDGRYLEVNEAFTRVTGYTREDAVGRTSVEIGFITPEDRETLRQHVVEHGRVDNLELALRHKSGAPVHCLYSGELMEIDGHRRLVSMAVDITERQQAAKALRDSEQRYREMFEKNRSVKLLIDPRDGRIVDANPAATRFYGSSRDQLTALRIMDINTMTDAEVKAEMAAAVAEDRGMFHFRHRVAGGEIRDVDVYSSPVVVGGRKMLYSIIHDVTEQRRAEAELRRLAAAIEQVGEAIVMTDPDGAIEYVNPAFTVISGYSAEEAIGNTPRLLQSGEHSQEFYQELWGTITSGQTWQGRFVNRNKAGDRYVESSTISPVLGPDGSIENYVAVKRDITEQERLHEEREQLRAQYHQAQKMEAVGRLAGGVAHDLNNLLTPVLGYSELLIEDLAADAGSRQLAEQIFTVAVRARELVGQLLAFGRRQPLEIQVVDLNESIERFIPLLRRTIREDIVIHWQPAERALWVRVDEGQLEQVLMNLAVNAQDAMHGGGEIHIATAMLDLTSSDDRQGHDVEPGRYVALGVADTGEGMGTAVRERAFEPFFTTKPLGEGTGLGLSTVHGIVTQHGGRISLASEPGEGTELTVLFPSVAKGRPKAVTRAPASGSSQRGHETVLVVEDDETVRVLVVSILSRFGYEVLEARSGEEALRILATQADTIQLLVTDVIMPGMDGKELADQVLAAAPNVRVLFMSGYPAKVIAGQTLLHDGADIIQKPFTVATFLARVRAVLSSRSGASQNVE